MGTTLPKTLGSEPAVICTGSADGGEGVTHQRDLRPVPQVLQTAVCNLYKSLILSGGQRRDRTADAGLFRAALYH